jgi:hypothetical protein
MQKIKIFERKVHESMDELAERINQFIGNKKVEHICQSETPEDTLKITIIYNDSK